MPESDGQLYLRFLNEGEEEALRILFEEYKESLTLFINGFVDNLDDAEDLMMDTFAILASGTARYVEKREGTFKTWLFSIGKNQARMFIRKKKFGFISLDDDEIREITDAEESQPDFDILKNERRAAIYQALNEIKDDYKQVLYLAYFEDMKPEQISRVMKISPKQTYNLITRGKTALKGALEKKGFSWNI